MLKVLFFIALTLTFLPANAQEQIPDGIFFDFEIFGQTVNLGYPQYFSFVSGSCNSVQSMGLGCKPIEQATYTFQNLGKVTSGRTVLWATAGSEMNLTKPVSSISFFAVGNWSTEFAELGITAYDTEGNVVGEQGPLNKLSEVCLGLYDFSSSSKFVSFGPYANGAKIAKIKFNSATYFDDMTLLWEPIKTCHVKDKGRIVEHLSQLDSAWNKPGEKYDHINKTIAVKGCALTGLAMIFKSYGLKQDLLGASLTPGTLNTGLINYNFSDIDRTNLGYESNGNLNWQGASLYARAAFINQCISEGGGDAECIVSAESSVAYKGRHAFDKDAIRAELCDGNPVLLEVPGIKNPKKQHFVVAVGTKVISGREDYLILDPAYRDVDEAVLSDRYSLIRGARLFHPSSDPSMLFVTATDSVDFVVTDPLGRKTGFNPISKESFSEIPGAKYIVDEAIDNLDGSTDFLDPIKTFEHMDSPIAGNYTIQIYSIAGGAYEIKSLGFDAKGYANSVKREKGNIAANGSKIFKVVHSEKALPMVNAEIKINKFLINQKPRKEEDKVIIQGKLIPNDKNIKSINLNEQFKLNIDNFSVTVSAADFAKKINRKRVKYIYKNRLNPDLKIVIESDGSFVFKSKQTDIIHSNPEKLLLEIQIDNLKSLREIQIKCNKSNCKGVRGAKSN